MEIIEILKDDSGREYSWNKVTNETKWMDDEMNDEWGYVLKTFQGQNSLKLKVENLPNTRSLWELENLLYINFW